MVVLATVVGCGPSSPEQATGTASSLTVADPHAVSLIFSANLSYGASEPLAAGDLLDVSYDATRSPTCQVSSDGEEAWVTSAFFQYNGGAIGSVVVAGSGAAESPQSFSLPTGAGGELAVWFETTNEFGCQQWDSNYGQNFNFLVAAHGPAAPSWLGNADSILTRADCTDEDSQCDSSRHDLDVFPGFTFDTLARDQDVYTRVEFQAWLAGVTDFDNANLWQQLDTQIHWRIGGTGDYTTSYVDFDRREGNNARYSVDLRALDPLPTPVGGPITDASLCPAFPTTLSQPDGQYIQAEMDFWFTVNGVTLRNTNGQNFQGTFSQYAGLYAVCTVAD
jgi:Family of unknown function (DUF6209)